MPEGITLKRIIDMDEATELSSSDYALVDSATGGPKKFALGNELSSLKEDFDSLEPIVTAAYVTDTASGAIASFPDGADGVPVKSLKVNIEPVQDLHGYESPWPAGGGKNLCPIATMNTTNGGYLNSSTGTVGTVVAGTQYTFSLLNNTTSTANLIVRMVVNGSWVNLAEGNLVSKGTKSYTFTPENSGDVSLSAYLGADYSPAISNLQLEKGSTASAYVPYSNICPISGHTQAVVTRTGKNLVDISKFAEEYPQYCSYANGVLSVTANGTLFSTGINVFVPSGSIVNWSITNGTAVNARVRFVYADGTVVSVSNPSPYPIVKDIVALRFDWSSGGTFTVNNFKAELGSTASTYEPYNGQTVTIDLGGTRYGGTLDVTTGVLTVDRAMVDLGSLTWTYYTSGTYPILYAEPSGHRAYVNGEHTDAICENYSEGNPAAARSTLASGNLPDKSFSWISGASGSFTVRDSSYTSAAAFKAAMDGVKLVYPLATPFTIQLTANEISTVLGQNNIWNDCGDTEVTYRADTKLYIQKVLNA